MWVVSLMLISIGLALRVRDPQPEKLIPTTPSYKCPTGKSLHNDTTVEFFTKTRMPGDTPKLISLETPTNPLEFNCGIIGRSIDCVHCGILFEWEKPAVREIFFRNITSPADLIFLDQYKQVIGLDTATGNMKTGIKSPGGTVYTLAVSAGTVKDYGIEKDDPMRVVVESKTAFVGRNNTLVDDGIAMHNNPS